MTQARQGRPPTLHTARETILASAARLFADQGYERTTLKDVADAVGLSKAAIYHYYPTKQDIYEAIISDLLQNLHDSVRDRVAEETAYPDKLRAFMVAHADYLEANLSAFVTLIHGISGIGAPRSASAIEVRDSYERLLRDLLSEGAAAGALRIGDVATSARAILSMLNWMARWFRPDGGRHARDFAGDFFEMFYEGVRVR